MDLVWSGFRQALALIVGADGEIWEILWLSLQVSGTATLISLALGVPAGAAIALARFPGPCLVVSAVNTGMGLPPVVVGLLVTLLLWRSGPFGALEILYTPAAIVIAQALIASPIVTGITLAAVGQVPREFRDRKSTRLNSSHDQISYAVFCLKKKNTAARALPS